MQISDNVECLICYGELNDNFKNIIIPCEHTICCTCLKEIVISNENPCCPFDRKKIEFIIDFAEKENPKKFDISTFRIMSFAIKETSLLNDIEKKLSNYIRTLNVNVTEIIDLLKQLIELVNNWIRNQLKLNEEEIERFSSLFTKLISRRHININFHKEINDIYKIRGITKKLNTSQSFNNLSKNLILQSIFPIYKYYDLAKSIQFGNVLRKIDIIKLKETLENGLKEIQEIFLSTQSFIITFLRNNNEIFLEFQPNFIQTNIDNCLICTIKIETNIYSRFVLCDHKICLVCIRKFMITHASCPFDDCDLQELQIYDADYVRNRKSANEYLTENINSIISEYAKQRLEFETNDNEHIYQLFGYNSSLSNFMVKVVKDSKEITNFTDISSLCEQIRLEFGDLVILEYFKCNITTWSRLRTIYECLRHYIGKENMYDNPNVTKLPCDRFEHTTSWCLLYIIQLLQWH